MIGLRVEFIHVSEKTVDAEPQARLVFFRLKVDVRGAKREGAGEEYLQYERHAIQRIFFNCRIELCFKRGARGALLGQFRERFRGDNEHSRL